MLENYELTLVSQFFILQIEKPSFIWKNQKNNVRLFFPIIVRIKKGATLLESFSSHNRLFLLRFYQVSFFLICFIRITSIFNEKLIFLFYLSPSQLNWKVSLLFVVPSPSFIVNQFIIIPFLNPRISITLNLSHYYLSLIRSLLKSTLPPIKPRCNSEIIRMMFLHLIYMLKNIKMILFSFVRGINDCSISIIQNTHAKVY